MKRNKTGVKTPSVKIETPKNNPIGSMAVKIPAPKAILPPKISRAIK